MMRWLLERNQPRDRLSCREVFLLDLSVTALFGACLRRNPISEANASL
jgi:hypothetical protein